MIPLHISYEREVITLAAATVTAKSGLRLRKSAGTDSAIIDTMPYNTKITTTDSKKVGTVTWHKTTYKGKSGWASGDYLKFTSGSTATPQPGNTVGKKGDPNANPIQPNQTKQSAPVYNALTKSIQESIKKSIQGYAIENLNNVFGLPFHFMPNVDRPINDAWNVYGRMFSREYLVNTPIVSFVPGTPDFFTSTTWGLKNSINPITGKVDKKSAFDAYWKNEDEDFLNKIKEASDQSSQMDFFSLKPAMTVYYDYVNSLCRLSANMMGLGKTYFKGQTLGNFDWAKYSKDPITMNGFQKIFGMDEAVTFAYDPMSALSDTLSNSTSESVLSSGSKAISAKAREAEFIFGVGAGQEMAYMSDENIEQLVPELTDMKKYDPSNPFSRVAGLGKTISTGANLRFPEVWGDSQFSRSYSLDMKFRSPYSDALSRFLYVIVPFWHIFCLGAPRSTSAASYASPFIVRAVSKGSFSIDAGMLDSITFKKFGDGEDIAEDGVPMEIEISVSFKDLYQALSMTPFKLGSMSGFFSNSGLIDLMGSITGVDIARFNWAQRTGMYVTGAFESIINTPGRFSNSIQDRLRNALEGIAGR